MSQSQLQNLLAQKKYRQAIDEVRKLQRSQPDAKITPTEAEIWQLRGQQELEKGEFRAAENSFRQALKLGLGAHYWLAKALLGQNRLDTALELIRTAFNAKTLSKEDGICYLKLLLLKGDRDSVETLIQTHAKRFSAAQLHWARGVLALAADDPETALAFFSKLKKAPLTPGESTDAWLTYTHQQLAHWDAAGAKLGLLSGSLAGTQFARPRFVSHPALQKLAIWQQATIGDPRRALTTKDDRSAQEMLTGLSAVALMAEGNFHDAGHAVLQITGAAPRLADLTALRSTILTLAGQQAMDQGEFDCALNLWAPLQSEKRLEPQLMVNWIHLLREMEEYQERQRLLTRLIKWIEQEAKQDKATWPDDRLKLTLAHAHCLLGDSWLALDRARAAFGEIQQAERLCPTSPEVMGRQGLIMSEDGKPDQAIELIIQAFDQGCQSYEVYIGLQEILLENGRKDEALAMRKRYGKLFGDLNIEADIEIEPWITALSTNNYEFFKGLMPPENAPEPCLRACQIFAAAAHGKPTNTGKISIHQDQAIAAWARLLDQLTPIKQAQTLQAIALCLAVLSKRDKGITALITRYQEQIFDLIPTVTEARVIHLIVSAIKETNPDKLQVWLKPYLDTQPQPGNALALLQLQVRWFGLTVNLRSFIDKALSREPQNPLLLLAKATSYTAGGQVYQQLREQGFELARQMQDAAALQAFRVEDYYMQGQEIQSLIPAPGNVANMMPADIESMFENMVRKTLGKDLPRNELDRVIPLLKQKFLDEIMPGMGSGSFGSGGFNDDDFDDFDPIFGPPDGSSKRKKRKPTFMDL
jgi:tetratricopeptide (TPR) repeat protein